VIVPARTPDKARAALAAWIAWNSTAMDLADPKSIDAFAARSWRGAALHLLLKQRRHHGRSAQRDAAIRVASRDQTISATSSSPPTLARAAQPNGGGA